MSYRIAVVGATGNVGRQVLGVLAERRFPASEVIALASSASQGVELSYGEKDTLRARNLADYDFAGTDFAFFAAGSDVSKEYGPKAAAAGTIVIDKSSYFRLDPAVPLVIPEINSDALKDYKKKNIIANPNCSTTVMALPLAALQKVASIARVFVSSYQSVSGAGKKAMDELYSQTKSVFSSVSIKPHFLPRQIAFNVIPQIDTFMSDHRTKEEWKMEVETQKILDNYDFEVIATCVRVPVFVGHACAVTVVCQDDVSRDDFIAALREMPGIFMLDRADDASYVTPLDAAGEDHIFVSRVRVHPTDLKTVSFWAVGDNLRKGAALNAVQIAEYIIKEGL